MNRRNRARFKTDLTAHVTLAGLSGATLKGRLADLSVHGLSLILSMELPVGSRVKVEWGNATFEGESIYCRNQGKEYLVGLKVDAAVYATTKNLRPVQ